MFVFSGMFHWINEHEANDLTALSSIPHVENRCRWSTRAEVFGEGLTAKFPHGYST